MDTGTVANQFTKDPGTAFLEIIRTSPEPVSAREIKKRLIDAGAKKADVDRRWPAFQRVVKLHPQITAANTRYGWSADPRSAQSSLTVLAGNLLAKLPPWLAQPLVRNVASAVDGAESTHRAGNEFEQARMVAALAVAVDVLHTRGDTIAEVSKLFAEETRRKRLWPLGRRGETVAFDPVSHEAEMDTPAPGATVRVARPGYVWRGGGEPVVAAKAIVTV
ncbi:hypothetical protein AB0M02_28195 [Actinoplanes sp. NPDC051861]|uniref:hypothetical protein n=1 Tax=Actinoplanes sp. NPDC051861 TaxID=3155170 RepID=UPI0034340154